MGRSISNVDIRFKGGSGKDGASDSSRRMDGPPESPPRLSPNVLVLGGFKVPTSVDADDGLWLDVVARGAEETRRPV